MKTRERRVHFYDIKIESKAKKGDVKNPSCASIDDILAGISSLNPKGHEIRSNSVERIAIEDWQKYSGKANFYGVLINNADADTSDVVFKDLKTRKARRGGKTKIEGIEVSAHLLISPNSDGRSAKLLMTMGSGVSFSIVETAFRQLIKKLQESKNYDDLFWFNHPSGASDQNGLIKYEIRYEISCVAHLGSVLKDAIKGGNFVSMELIAHNQSAFDAGGNLQIKQQSILVETANATKVSAASIANSIKAYIIGKSLTYDQVRIKYSEKSNIHTTTLDVNHLDAAFTHNTVIHFLSDVEGQQTSISPVVMDELKKLV